MAFIYGRHLVNQVTDCNGQFLGRFEPLQFKFTDEGQLCMVDYTDYLYNQASVARKPSTNSLMAERYTTSNV
jgi:hypothetical protein